MLIVFVSLNVEFLKGQTTVDPLSVLISEVFGVFNETDTNNATSFTDQSQQTCDCVPVNECRKYNNSEITTYGEGVIDIRYVLCWSNYALCSRDLCSTTVCCQLKPFFFSFKSENFTSILNNMKF